MHDVNKNVAIILKSRQQRSLHTPPPMIQNDLEKRIHNSVIACETCLKTMKKRLQPLSGHTEQTLRKRIPDSVAYLFARDEIALQERIIDKHVDGISLSLTLLHCVDQAATHELVQTLVRLLNTNSSALNNLPKGGTFASDDPTANTTIEQQSDNISTDDSLSPSHKDAETEDLDLPTTPDDQAKLLQPAAKPIMIAVKENQLAEVKALIRNSKDSTSLYVEDVEGWTVLHHAVRNKAPEILELLLDAGLAKDRDMINRISKQGHTALMGVAKHSDHAEAAQMAMLLIDSGCCDVNIKDKTDRTALCFAIEDPPSYNSEKFARLLVDRGHADVMIVHKNMPKQVAKYRYLEQQVRSQQTNQRDNSEPFMRRLSRALSITGSKNEG